MSETERRHTRYIVPEGAMASQHVRVYGIFGIVRGWSVCRIKDLSRAGVMVLTERQLGIGDRINIRLVDREGVSLNFKGEVANVGRDHREERFKIGIALHVTAQDVKETQFLDALAERFREVV
ncbi:MULTISPECIES: PilZ domain-containing protein [Pseudomonas]|uniref:PilZ domain-containing protein n=1 Tax=Pseudomonas fluorescens TaxID=294 RepID=A0A166QRH6_PSEFL|nr:MULTISPECIES: PilZ domain-containing protein [Pseudomonas]KZN20741.1 hypothetical protein A1D17_04140 [Pseudomonas fluorescens]